MPPLRFPEFSDEWEKQCLGNLGTTIIGLTYKPSDVTNDGSGIIVFRSSNIQKGMIDYSDLVRVSKKIKSNLFTQEDDILICARNGSAKLIGKNAIIEKSDANKTFGAFMMIYRSQQNRFVKQLLETRRYATQISENLGARINQVTTSDFNGFEFFFPKTDEEKKKIAIFLRLIDKRITLQTKIIEDLKKLKVAICNKLIDNLVNREPLICFSEVYSKAGEGGTPDTSKYEYYENGIIPFIKIDDLSNKYITSNKDFITDLGMQKSSAWIIPAHSLIYSNGATIGAISINTYEVCTKQGILGIVPKSAISVEYLYCLMSSNYFTKQVHRIITYGTMATAYLKDINKIKVPIPCMPQQLEIANTISSVTNKIETELNILSLLLKQKQYLLQQMFI